MWKYYCELASSAGHATLAVGSSTWFSMTVLSIGAVVLTSSLTLFVEWLRGGRSMKSFVAVWKQWPTYIIPSATIILLWAATFTWKLIQAPYLDHHKISSDFTDMKSDRNLWKQKFQSASITPAKPIASPPVLVNKMVRSQNPAESNGMRIMLTAAVSIPTDFYVICSAPCRGRAEAATEDSFLPGESTSISPTVVRVRFDLPGILIPGKSVLMLFSSVSGEPFSILKIKLSPR
jgi:hypothetical protein